MTWYERDDRVQLRYKAPNKGNGDIIELPFVIGVFAPLSGNANDNPLPIEDREFVDISPENFDETLRSFSPKLRFASTEPQTNKPGDYLEIRFSRLADFLPENLGTNNIPIDTILNSPEFLRLEATWRGVSYLVNCLEPSESTRIRVFDIDKAELGKVLAKPGELGPQNPLVRKSYLEPFCQPGGEPFGCFIGDYYFDQGEEDVRMLSALAEFSTLLLTPFIAGVSPGALPFELSNGKAELHELCSVPSSESWELLRSSITSRFLGLTYPRILVRRPHTFENEVGRAATAPGQEGSRSSAPCWANAAYTMGANIRRSFQNTGWLGNIRGIESGGLIERTVEIGPKPENVVEMILTDRTEAVLATAGYMPLIQISESIDCAFIGGSSVHLPAQHKDFDRQADEHMASRLGPLLTVSRFAHYLKCQYRDQENLDDPNQVESLFRSWLARLIDQKGGGSAKRPLRAAALSVSELPDQPSLKRLSIAIEAYYRLGGMCGLLRLDTLLFSDGANFGQGQTILSVSDPMGVFYPKEKGERVMKLVHGSHSPYQSDNHKIVASTSPLKTKAERKRAADLFNPDPNDPEWYGATWQWVGFFIFMVIMMLWSWLGK